MGDRDLHINRGVDLMLSGGGPKELKESRKTWEVYFGKLMTFFHREIDFHFQISLDIKKK